MEPLIITPIALVALFGLAAFLPIFVNNDDDVEGPVDPIAPEEPVEPVDPTEPVAPDEPVDPVVPVDPVNPTEGTDVSDILTTAASDILNGRGGNDTLSATETSNSAILNGGRDDDTFNIEGTGNIANGDRGDDTFSVTDSNAVINGDSGSDSFSVDGDNVTINSGSEDDSIFSSEDNSNSLLNGGLGNDEFSVAGTNITVNGDEGDDIINYSAVSGEVFGNIGDDTINVTPSNSGLSGTFTGNGGNDVITASDTHIAHGGVHLIGGDHEDILTSRASLDLRSSETGQDTLTGGRHDDTFNIDLVSLREGAPEGRINIATITNFTRGENTLNIRTNTADASELRFQGLELSVAEDGSYTDVIANYTSANEGVGPTQAVVRVEGVSNLTLDDINLSTGNSPTSGDDILSTPGQIGALDTLFGGAGDDLLIHIGSDSSGELVMQGNAGNDTLIANEVEFGNNTTLDGGSGDDVLKTDLFVTSQGDSFDTFITGAGADTIEISFLDVSDREDIDVGLMGRVTDFSPGEDMLLIDPSWLVRGIENGEAQGYVQSLTLTENTDEEYTDVTILLEANANGNTFTATIRLENLTGLSESDIGFAVAEPDEGPAERSGIVVGF